jgi:DNA mismatch repair protein MutL
MAQFSVTPALDFDLDPSIQQLDAVAKPVSEQQREAVASSSLFKSFTQKHQAHLLGGTASDLKDWKEFFKKEDHVQSAGSTAAFEFERPRQQEIEVRPDAGFIQVQSMYIIATTNRGFILVHQQLAHERILYERLSAAASGKPVAYQRSLFPQTLQLSKQDAVLLEELLADLLQLGYLVEPFGKDCFVIQGTPADIDQGNEKPVIENLLEQFKHFSSDLKFSKREKLIRSLAQQQSVKPGVALTNAEMHVLVQDLFGCAQPGVNASGNPTYIEFRKEYVDGLFKK